MLARALAIAWEMCPSVDLVIKSVIRVGMALAVWPWFEFGGKFLLMLAAIGLVGHAEGTFAKHAASKVRKEAERALLFVAPFLTIWVRDKREDDNGMG
jgi:hypothetical protein